MLAYLKQSLTSIIGEIINVCALLYTPHTLTPTPNAPTEHCIALVRANPAANYKQRIHM